MFIFAVKYLGLLAMSKILKCQPKLVQNHKYVYCATLSSQLHILWSPSFKAASSLCCFILQRHHHALSWRPWWVNQAQGSGPYRRNGEQTLCRCMIDSLAAWECVLSLSSLSPSSSSSSLSLSVLSCHHYRHHRARNGDRCSRQCDHNGSTGNHKFSSSCQIGD